MFKYLQTQQGQIDAGIVIAVIILSAFILGSIRGNKRNKPTEGDLWTADGYYNYLLAVIKASCDMDELAAAWFMVENTWYTKVFRVPVSKFERNRKYAKLCEAYAKIETELTKVKVELCVN